MEEGNNLQMLCVHKTRCFRLKSISIGIRRNSSDNYPLLFLDGSQYNDRLCSPATPQSCSVTVPSLQQEFYRAARPIQHCKIHVVGLLLLPSLAQLTLNPAEKAGQKTCLSGSETSSTHG